MSDQNQSSACALIHVQPEPDGRFTASASFRKRWPA